MGAGAMGSSGDRYREAGHPNKIRVKRMFSHSSSGWRESSARLVKPSFFRPSKSCQGTEVFLNGNGEPDIVLEDCDGDGVYDKVTHIGPPSPTGRLPMLAFDGTDDGRADVIVVDAAGSGQYDQVISRTKAPLSFFAAMACASSDTLGENLNTPPRAGMLTEAEFQAERRCPAGHELRKRSVDAPSQQRCSACSRTFPRGTPLWGCRRCRFDLCAPCMRETYGRPLCPGWEAVMDDTSHSFFFHHSESGKSTWDRADAELPSEAVAQAAPEARERSGQFSWRPRRRCGYPTYWRRAGEEGAFQEVVSMDAAFVSAMQTLVTSTFVPIRTRDRTTTMPTSLKVMKVWRVENAAVWRRYAEHRGRLQDLARGREGGSLANLKPMPRTMDALAIDHSKSLDASVSEVYLFHGTSPQGALGIADAGFDISKTTSGCLYGHGIYLAECSSKSDEYAEEDAEGLQAGNCAMLLCRAALGGAFVWDKDVGKDLVREWARSGCHSIVGDRQKLKGTYREFVMPKANCQGVYPEYIIIYRREFGNPAACGARA